MQLKSTLRTIGLGVATAVVALIFQAKPAQATQWNCMTGYDGNCYCEWISSCPGKYCPNGLPMNTACHSEVE